jgi:hypothetical protein
LNKTYRAYDGPLREEACTQVSSTLGIHYTSGAAKKDALRAGKRCRGLGEREEGGGGVKHYPALPPPLRLQPFPDAFVQGLRGNGHLTLKMVPVISTFSVTFPVVSKVMSRLLRSGQYLRTLLCFLRRLRRLRAGVSAAHAANSCFPPGQGSGEEASFGKERVAQVTGSGDDVQRG